MKIIYRTGNILNSIEPVIAHGCNAQGKMNSGVAKAIRGRFPKAYDVYMDWHANGNLRLGSAILALCPDKTVVNLITQRDYGYDGRVYLSYDALISSLMQLQKYANFHGWREVAMPKIGAGLGGGNWNIIERIIEETLTDVQPVVYVLECNT